MKVLMQNRVTSRQIIAGDAVQMEKTGEYLRRMGVDLKFDFSLKPDLTGYDLVHLFNLIPVEDTFKQLLNARKYPVKVILSTIYWNPGEYLRRRSDYPDFERWWQRTLEMRTQVLAGVDLILPNSQLELNALQEAFPKLPPAIIIPNAADMIFAGANANKFVKRFGVKDFLLSVGRISPRKNQLALIQAAKRVKLPLVLIGPLNDGFYYQECRREAAGTGYIFIDTMDQTELAAAYAAARVHALVSWYDTPGLVSLEAALAGCSIVTTDRGSAREYFGDLAFYCQPDSLDSIEHALEQAWACPADPRVKERVMHNYTWEKVAEQTLEAYQRVMSN